MNFAEYLMPLAMAGCLVLGYCLKQFKRININDYIPTILAVVGALIAGSVNGFSMESIIIGAISGLASTGLHQAFTRFIEGLSGNGGKR
ncbi:phage holin family protein [Candidatus Enterococcus ferrettii]|uniref:Holin n=1 Tax=Candidatus Enterococcus ferrettii TaxID=2815324 RepID=A0ABV0EZ58_9ENTE|nr:phage holin family protein [Enterococcus sp. 665A]MBO1341405.1 phage holin family protein [Enterococcus sp. 665A]